MNINDQGESRKPSTPAPAGMQYARCVFVVDLGTQQDTYQGTVKHNRKIQIGWELIGTVMPKENPTDPDKPFIISKEYTASFGSKANLRKMAEVWLGKTYSDAEAAQGLNVREILGKECVIQIIHETKPDSTGQPKTRAKLISVSPVMPGTQIPPSKSTPFVFEIGAPDQFQIFPMIYGWLRYDQKRNGGIVASPEFIAECQKHGLNPMTLHQQATDAWKAANPQNNQQAPQQSAMQPNQQWMQQGQQQQTVPGYGQSMQNPAPQQYQQPAQTGFGQQQQMPPAPQQTGFGGQQQAYQQPVAPQQPQYQQPANVPPGYQQPQQYPQNPVPPQRTMDAGFGQPQASPAFGQGPIQGGFGQNDPNGPF